MNKHVLGYLACVLAAAGCASETEDTVVNLVQAGSEAQRFGVYGYTLERTSDVEVVVGLVDGVGTEIGSVVVSRELAGVGEQHELRVELAGDVTERYVTQFADGTFSMVTLRDGGEDDIRHLGAITVPTDQPFGAILSDLALAPALATFDLRFEGQSAEAAFDTCDPMPNNNTCVCPNGTSASAAPNCEQTTNCDTVYDTCYAQAPQYCYDQCVDPYAAQFYCAYYGYCDCYYSGGSYGCEYLPGVYYACNAYQCGTTTYAYQCNPHQGNCVTTQHVTYNCSTACQVDTDRVCGLDPGDPCPPGAQTATAGTAGCCLMGGINYSCPTNHCGYGGYPFDGTCYDCPSWGLYCQTHPSSPECECAAVACF